MPTAASPALDVDAIRQDFPILNRPLPRGTPLVYLDNASTAQKPRVVIEKIVDCYENYYSNVHRGFHHLGERVTLELEGTRHKVQQLIGAAEPEEVIFTAGTTMSINLVANGWGRKFLEPGDELLLNEMEHHANLVPWQQIAREKGATLRFIPLTDDGRLDLQRLDEVLTTRTRLVSVTGMSNVLGTINPIDELARRAHEVGALVVVDGAQSVPHLPVDVQHPQIDFLAFSGHKLFGPSGVGVLYGRRELLEAMDPFLCGGNMIHEVFLERSTWADLPAKFEAGTLPIVPAIGLGAAIDYVNELGYEAIHAHEQRLLERAHAVLAEIPDLTIFGPDVSHKGSIVSFVDRRVHPQDMSEMLNRRGIALRIGHHCTMPLHARLHVPATARASFAFYNTEAEVDRLADGIRFAREKFRVA